MFRMRKRLLGILASTLIGAVLLSSCGSKTANRDLDQIKRAERL